MRTVRQGYSISRLLSSTQEELLQLVTQAYTPKIQTDSYVIIGRGRAPKPMLCVHLDTINTGRKLPKYTPNDIVYNRIDNTLGLSDTSTQICLGADDRAGVWIALQLIQEFISNDEQEWKYDIGFFCDEEIGGIGSSNYKNDIPFIQDIDTTCYIGLDRRSTNGRHEVATYGIDNPFLIEKFTSLGYKETLGSFTDASNLADRLACINLSVGYDNEHTNREVLYLDCMEHTLNVLLSLGYDSVSYPAEYNDMYSGWYDDEEAYTVNYIYELERENECLKDALEAMGINAEDLLKEIRNY